MRKTILLLAFLSMLLIIGCNLINEINATMGFQSPPSTIPNAGVYGTITLRTGDCMPRVCEKGNCGPSRCHKGPATGEIYVFNSVVLTNQSEFAKVFKDGDIRKSIAKTTLNESGFYNISVPSGNYVLFFHLGPYLVCGQGDCDIVTVNDSYVQFDQYLNFATD